MLAVILPWVSSVPLGSPVVPPCIGSDRLVGRIFRPPARWVTAQRLHKGDHFFSREIEAFTGGDFFDLFARNCFQRGRKSSSRWGRPFGVPAALPVWAPGVFKRWHRGSPAPGPGIPQLIAISWPVCSGDNPVAAQRPAGPGMGDEVLGELGRLTATTSPGRQPWSRSIWANRRACLAVPGTYRSDPGNDRPDARESLQRPHGADRHRTDQAGGPGVGHPDRRRPAGKFVMVHGLSLEKGKRFTSTKGLMITLFLQLTHLVRRAKDFHEGKETAVSRFEKTGDRMTIACLWGYFVVGLNFFHFTAAGAFSGVLADSAAFTVRGTGALVLSHGLKSFLSPIRQR